MKITVSQLRKIIREEVENLSRPGSLGFGESPDPQDVQDAFRDLKREECGACDGRGKAWDETCVTCGGTGFNYIDEKEVSLKDLAHELGVDPENIDWNGTGLRMIGGVVTELL